MKLMVIGGGGREHAIVKALKKADFAAFDCIKLITAGKVNNAFKAENCAYFTAGKAAESTVCLRIIKTVFRADINRAVVTCTKAKSL